MKGLAACIFLFFCVHCAAGCDSGGGEDGDADMDVTVEDTGGSDPDATDDPDADLPADIPSEATHDPAGEPDGIEEPEPDVDPCLDHCENHARDCGETDVDCGGGCEPCPEIVMLETQDGRFPTVAATADRVVLAWCQRGGVKYMCRDDSGWTSVLNLDIGVSHVKSTRLAEDSLGRFHMTVTKGAGVAIAYLRLSAGATCSDMTWSDPVDLVTAGDGGGRYAGIAIDDNDDPHVCWQDQAYDNIYYRRATGGEWPDPIIAVTETPHDSRFPDITVLGTIPHIMYEQDDASESNCHPTYTYREGEGWAAPVDLVTRYHSWPQIVADADGRMHVLYTRRLGDCEVKYRRKVGDTWEPEKELHSAPTNWTQSSLVIDEGGGLHAVWHQLVGGMAHLYYCTGDSATGDWNTPRLVSTDSSLNNWQGDIDIDPEGFAHIIWMHGDANDGGGWEETFARIVYRKVAFDDLSP